MEPPGARCSSGADEEPPTETVDVVVIGAGLSGLTAATGLTRVGKKVKVVESDASIEATGAIMGLSPSGTLCLEALGPDVYELVKEARSLSCVLSNWYTKEGAPVDKMGTDIMDCLNVSKAYGPADAKGFGCCNLHMIRTALADHLPEGCLELGCHQERYTEDANGVTVYFNNRPPIRAQLLIGADGAKSSIRTQCLGEQTSQVLTRVCCHGLVRDPPKNFKGCDSEETSHIWMDGPRFGGVLRMNAPGGTKQTAWKFARPVTPEAEARLKEIEAMPEGEAKLQEQLKLCMEGLEGFDEEFVALVGSTDVSVFQQECMYQSPPRSVWGRGRVTLCGNAAHSVSIEAGVGPAMGLEDALALADCIRRWGATAQALRCYEFQRVHRVTRVQVAMAAKCKLSCCGNRMSAEKARLLKFIYNYKPQPLIADADKDCFSSNTADSQAAKRPVVSTPPLCPEPKRCCHEERTSAVSTDQSM